MSEPKPKWTGSGVSAGGLARDKADEATAKADILRDLKAERDRLNRTIARLEGSAAGRKAYGILRFRDALRRWLTGQSR